MQGKRRRLAFIVSHPIQYYVPLYRRLADRGDIELRVFYTWHAGGKPQSDPGFGRDVQWDIPLLQGYDFELVPNHSQSPGTHHFFGLRNPTLIRDVARWRPDIVHLTGYAFASHILALWKLRSLHIPVMFRGDSHLLNQSKRGVHWLIKRIFLSLIYDRAAVCLYVGQKNHEYFRALGVPSRKLAYCPHSIDVRRFAEPRDELESRAAAWREELSIPNGSPVLLFAGKFEPQKRPLQLMDAVLRSGIENLVLMMVGDGELAEQVHRLAGTAPSRFRILPFQNQSLMPVVYRLGDIFVLPSGSETWGLAVNEALASGRRVIVSDRVGCAADVVNSLEVGEIFSSFHQSDFGLRLAALLNRDPSPKDILRTALRFDLSVTEETLCQAIDHALGLSM